jgi:NADPH-dependent 2,4-dienoyl-CoA reductase/sulfur reductase-like enzyme
MGMGGAQALLKGGLDVRGRRVVVAGSGPLLLPVAGALARAGAHVTRVLEQTPWSRLAQFATSLVRQPAKLLLAARYSAAIPFDAYRAGTWVERADGMDRVESVTITNGRRRWSEPCDLLCSSYGLVPMTELAQLLRCTIADGKVAVDGRQRTSVAHVYCAGETTGIAGDSASLAEGEIAGLCAATTDEAPLPREVVRARDLGRTFQGQLRRAFLPRREVLSLADAETIICRCEDVRFGRLERSWTGRQAKLYTRIGMGACQGAVCGPIVQQLFGWPPGSVRPPLFAPLIREWLPDDSQAIVESSGPGSR